MPNHSGIFGRPQDPQVVAVVERLQARGTDPTVVDLSRFPTRLRLSISDGTPRGRGADGTIVPFARIGRWYVRTMPLPLPFQPLAVGPGFVGDADAIVARTRTAYAAGRERRSFVAGFVAALQSVGAELVNPPAAMIQHFRKLEQLDTLRSAGISIPATLATNDPEELADFADGGRRSVVYKPLAGGGACRRLTADDLRPARLSALALAPVLFQEELAGANLRVYVVAGQIVAAFEICSDDVDYRGNETAVRPTTISEAEAHACLASAEACDMALAGIDVRRRVDADPEQGFAVLDVNPSPMFAAIQRRTATTVVADAIAAHIAG